MNRNKVQSLGVMIVCVLAIITLCRMDGPSGASASFLYEPDHYGIVYLYPFAPSEWEPADYGAMEQALNGAKDMGFDTIIQPFPAALIGSGDENHWRLFLDAAQATGIDVVAYLWPSSTYTGNPDDPFYYDDLKAFLDVVTSPSHPALIGYIGLHEPLEEWKGISDDELKAFYTEMKTYAPNLEIAHYMADMAYAEATRTDDWHFSDGMCDICMIWYYPFRYVDGDPVYEEELVLPVVQSNVALVNERAPDAEVWFLGQSFALAAHRRNLRMPTADEMVHLYLLVMQEPVNGFLWYPWSHTEAMADEALGDEGMEEQQEAAKEIAETHMGYASLEISKSASPSGTILYPGDTITYTLTFTNYGPHVADSAVITDLIPSDLFTPTIVGSSGAVVTHTPGVTFAWTIDPLEVGDGGMITLTGVISPGLKTAINITNTAEITAPVARSSATLSSTAAVAVSELPGNLGISKSVLPVETAVYPGDTITYTLTFTNYGPRVADSVVITDLMPGDLFTPTIVGSSGAVVTRTHGVTFAWTVAPLEVGDGGMITLSGVISPGLESVISITNTAKITAPLVYDSPALSSTVTISVSLTSKVYMPWVMKNG